MVEDEQRQVKSTGMPAHQKFISHVTLLPVACTFSISLSRSQEYIEHENQGYASLRGPIRTQKYLLRHAQWGHRRIRFSLGPLPISVPFANRQRTSCCFP